MIAKGWAKIGLDAIFSAERQGAALLSLTIKGIRLDDPADDRVEEEATSAADLLDAYAEGDEDEVEEDEEEADINVNIAACLEEKAVIQSVRRSSRLAGRRDLLRDSRMAALMQEQLYEDGCADDD